MLFRFISGIKLHADGYLVPVQQQPHSDNGVMTVFLARAFLPEFIFLIDLEIEVGAVKIGFTGVYAESLLHGSRKETDKLLIFRADIFASQGQRL